MSQYVSLKSVSSSAYDRQLCTVVGDLFRETRKPSGWLPLSSLGTLKLAFNVSSDDQGSHPDDFPEFVFTDLILQVMTWVTRSMVRQALILKINNLS